MLVHQFTRNSQLQGVTKLKTPLKSCNIFKTAELLEFLTDFIYVTWCSTNIVIN